MVLLIALIGLHAQETAGPVHSTADGLVLTPPMGWYPWNQFGQEPQTEQLIKEIADAVVSSGMRDAGYQFVGPDEGICFERGTNGLLTTVLILIRFQDEPNSGRVSAWQDHAGLIHSLLSGRN